MSAALEAQVSFSRELSAFLISRAATRTNIVYSPLCIHSLLNLLTFGTIGRTREQLIRILQAALPISANYLLLDGYASGGPCLLFAGGLWVDGSDSTKLKMSIIEHAIELYNMWAHPIYFRAMPEKCRNDINKWVEDATAGHLKNLLWLGSITVETGLVLGNAIHFKGKWSEKFEPQNTRPGTFCLPDGSSVTTLFMGSNRPRFISVYDGFKVLKLPYEQGQDWRKFSFYIFLPEAVNGVHDLSVKMSTQSDFFNKHIPAVRVPVGEFRIPKFKLGMTLNSAEALTRFGLDLPFKMTGDFSQMVDSPNAGDYYVSKMAHGCSLEVSEEGAETAATAEAVLPIQPIDFVADHPFVFMHDSGANKRCCIYCRALAETEVVM